MKPKTKVQATAKELTESAARWLKPWRPARWQSGHQLRLLQGAGEMFPAMVAAMDAAQHSVHVETFIFYFDGTALDVAHALVRAAQRGVRVRLVVDDVGTPQVPAEWQLRFAQAGVQWRSYAPRGHLGFLAPSSWRRLHRKLCVVDGRVGFCGGINLIDDYFDEALGPLTAPRLDFSLQISGPLVQDMSETLERVWWRLHAVRPHRQQQLRAAWEAQGQEAAATQAPYAVQKKAEHNRVGSVAALVLRDNFRHRHDIERAYRKALGAARHDVLMAHAYFIPGRRLRRALTMAVQRGVRVRLLLQGKYENFWQYHAAKPVYHRLLAAGVEIYEYAPSALHAKVAVVDQHWITVGSSNLDPLSLLLAREANVVSTDADFGRALHQRLDALIEQHGQAITLAQLNARPWRQRWRDWLAFAGMRLSLFVLGQRY